MATIKKQLTLTFKQPNIAESYGPYASVPAAHEALADDQLNVVGMTVGIQTGNTIEEYWYQGGTTEQHLVKKQTAVEVDTTPTQNSSNAVSSGGVYNALQWKANTSDIPTISTNITTDATSDTKTASPKSVKTYVDNGLTGKQNTISASNTINSDFVDDTNGTNKFVTSTEKGLIGTAIQGIKKGTETLTPVSGVVTIPSDIEGAQATSVSSNQSATATIDSNHVLQLEIPRGADAVNPFKGWFNAVVTGEAGSRVITSETQNLPATPIVGDYAYVKTWDISGTAPSQTETPIAKIYECATAGTWSDSGRTADTSNVQTFASGEEVNEVHIVNDFTTGGTEDVASAETVKKLNTDKLDKQKKNISYTYTSIDSVGDPYPKTGYLQANGTEGNLSDDYKFRIDKFPVTEGNSYYITGKEGTSTSNSLAGFYDLNGNLIAGSLIDSGVANAEASRRKVIAPSGAAYIKIMTNDYEGDFNAKCEARTEIVTILQDNQDVIDSVGDVADLETTEKSTVVGAINEVANNLGEIEEIHVSPNLFDKSQIPNDEKIIGSDGSLQHVSSWTYNKRTILIQVEPNKVYHISGNNITVGRNIRCLAADGETYMKVLAPQSGTELSTSYVMPNLDGTASSPSMNTQFKTPANAAYVQFNVGTDTVDSSNTTMLELVGSSYNAEFVPSEYEKYGAVKYSVKQEAIPPIEEVEELNGRVNLLETTVNAISSTEQTINVFDKNSMVSGGYINGSNGSLNSPQSERHNIGQVEVLPNHFYYLAGRTCTVATFRCVTDTAPNSPIPLLGNNDASMGYYLREYDDVSVIIINGQFKTPSLPASANKLYLQFTIKFSDVGSDEYVMLLDVGEEYDPNLTVEEPVTDANYIPFGTRTIVKESALPSSILGMQDDVQQALTAANAANTKSENALRRKYKLKLLLVGSSHGMNTIAQLPWIAYNSGIDIEVGNVYIGSMSLQRLVGYIERHEKVNTVGWFKIFKNGAWSENSNIYFDDVFSYTDWDFISLQRSAGETWTNTQAEAEAEDGILDMNYSPNEPHHPNPVYISHNDALQYVLDCIRNKATNNPKILFNSGFATPMFYKSTEQQTVETISSIKDMKEQFGIDYYSTAVAIQNARNTFLRHIGYYSDNSDANKSNNLVYDGQHLDFGIGCYVASVCLLEYICRILGWSVLNYKGYGSANEIAQFNANATLHPERYTEPTDETMIVAKACAMCACDTPDTSSAKLSDRFKWKIDYNLSNDITASNSKGYCGNLDTYSTTLSGTISNVVITSKPWDRAQPSTTLVEGTDYTYDSSTGKVVIGSVQGDITITAS